MPVRVMLLRLEGVAADCQLGATGFTRAAVGHPAHRGGRVKSGTSFGPPWRKASVLGTVAGRGSSQGPHELRAGKFRAQGAGPGADSRTEFRNPFQASAAPGVRRGGHRLPTSCPQNLVFSGGLVQAARDHLHAIKRHRCRNGTALPDPPRPRSDPLVANALTFGEQHGKSSSRASRFGHGRWHQGNYIL
jgi:hypothetical protein